MTSVSYWLLASVLASGRTEGFGEDPGGGDIFPWEWNSLRSDTHSWRKYTPTTPLYRKMVMWLLKALVWRL
jgi:hypothetical protein